MDENRSPFFEKAPVIERVLGVQFAPISAFTHAHLGAFWRELGGDWSHVSDAPAVPITYETFPLPPIWPNPGMLLFGTPSMGIRVRIGNKAGDRIIQIQNDAIYYNWMGQGEGRSYPRWEAIRDEFFDLLKRFTQFIDSIGKWNPNQWEVTYLNHLPQNTVWKTPEDWNGAFSSPISLPYHLHKATLEGFTGQWRYVLDSNRGRLYADLRHASRLEGKQPREILALKLTARGPIRDTDSDWTLESGLAIGHDAIVNGFSKIASESAKRFWEEK